MIASIRAPLALLHSRRVSSEKTPSRVGAYPQQFRSLSSLFSDRRTSRGCMQFGPSRKPVFQTMAVLEDNEIFPPDSVVDGFPNQLNTSVQHYDYLVVGSGIAGLTYALQVADAGKVAIITKSVASEGSTRYAQGGVCAVLDPLDSVESHINDTIVAGDFLNDAEAVDLVCREGAAAVLELVDLGANFDTKSDGKLHLTREGGHEHKRIVHAADLTGAEIERALLSKIEAHENIELLENHFVTDLVTETVSGQVHCLGVDCFALSLSGRQVRFLAPVTMLAAGGSGHIYPSTTNPTVATGDGIALAARAGAEVANMEFMQFHPTSFYMDSSNDDELKRGNVFLISEAVRGEGGVLLNGAGERFMERYDDRLELAPRDVVARSIDAECKSRGEKCAFIDISHKPKEELLHHFPTIAAKCLEHGIDITKDPIPVTPAMHYTCGGVQTDLNAATSIPGLFACGEAAHTGLHGANRLASNSLLEGLVFARTGAQACMAYADAVSESQDVEEALLRASLKGGVHNPKISTSSSHVDAELLVQNELLLLRRNLQDALWAAAGIVRSTQSLKKGLQDVMDIGREVCQISTKGFSAELMQEWYEVANLLTVSELVITCAVMRKESRGLHYTVDYPCKEENQKQPSKISHPLKLASKLDAVHSTKFRSSVKLNKRSPDTAEKMAAAGN